MFPSTRAFLAVGALASVAACSSSKSTGPSYPTLAGTYNVSYVTTATPEGYPPQTLQTATGTVTLSNANSAGVFTGSYIQGTSSGTIIGEEQTDGGVQISQWGNPNVPPLEVLAYLQEEIPSCTFTDATTTGTSGTISGVALTISGGLTLPCGWSVSGTDEVLTTTLATTVSGSR